MSRLPRVQAGGLVNGTGRPAVEDGAVLVQGEQIVKVGPAAAVSCPDRAELLDFSTLTLRAGVATRYGYGAIQAIKVPPFTGFEFNVHVWDLA